jgi:hypothetical protein
MFGGVSVFAVVGFGLVRRSLRGVLRVVLLTLS